MHHSTDCKQQILRDSAFFGLLLSSSGVVNVDGCKADVRMQNVFV